MHLRSSTSLAKTKALVKSLMNRTELLLHVTIAPHCRSLTTTPAGTPGQGVSFYVIYMFVCLYVYITPFFFCESVFSSVSVFLLVILASLLDV